MSLLGRSAIKKMAFQFRKITPDRYKDVMHHLHNIQHPTDPFTKEFCECLRSGANEYLEHFIYKTLKDDLSFVIYNKDKKVAGVILNGISRPWDINESDVCLKLVKHQNLHEMLCRKSLANKNFNLFKEFDIKQIFEIRLLSLDVNFNENVLSKHLLYMTEVLARNQGFKVIKADTFGDFLSKQLKGKGFQSFNENLKDVQKSPVNFQIMYKKLEND